MDLKYMQMTDRDFVMGIDSHVNELQYKNRVYTKTGYIIWENGRASALFRFMGQSPLSQSYLCGGTPPKSGNRVAGIEIMGGGYESAGL